MSALAAGTAGGTSARLALFELRRDINAHLSMSGGVGRLDSDFDYHEVQTRIAATGTLTLGQWVLEDRNLITLSSESSERYRNRVRLSFPRLLGHTRLTAHVFDELFYDFDRHRILRNNLALGVGGLLGTCCRVELYHLWSDNRLTSDTNYLLATVSWRMGL